jgi:tyrosyl-DNA phosphodiesterase-1
VPGSLAVHLHAGTNTQDQPSNTTIFIKSPITTMDSKRSASAAQVPTSLTNPVSPPLKKRRLVAPEPAVQEAGEKAAETKPSSSTPSCFPSPFKLTKIRDLPPELNKDCISLKDILGDPIISECWQFNYMHDIDFILSAFDEDVRHLVKLHIVHGFWKREDPSRLALQVGIKSWDHRYYLLGQT